MESADLDSSSRDVFKILSNIYNAALTINIRGQIFPKSV